MPVKLTPAFVIFMITTAFTCNKDNPLDRVTEKITGKWEQHYSIGGMTGRDTVYPSYPTFLTLNADRSYTLEVNSQKATGTYSLSWMNSIYTSREEPGITFSPSAVPARLIRVTSDTMELFDNFTEPYGTTYSRKN